MNGDTAGTEVPGTEIADALVGLSVAHAHAEMAKYRSIYFSLICDDELFAPIAYHPSVVAWASKGVVVTAEYFD